MRMMCLLVLALAFGGLNAEEKMSPKVEELVHRNNLFAFELYHQLHNAHNLFISPYNISSTLIMPYNGARDQTKTEMGNVLHFDGMADVNENFAWLNKYLTQRYSDTSEDFRLLIANSIWLQYGLKIQQDFLNTLNKYFKTSLYRVDFVRQKETARSDINDWVKERTQGKIDEVIQDDDITPATKMVVLGAIYFKAKWASPFSKVDTRTQPFFTTSGQTLAVPMLNDTESFPFFQDQDISVLELPYAIPGPNLPQLSMVIVLPNETQGISELEKNLSLEKVENYISQLRRKRVFVTIPKFKFASNVILNETLAALGMPTAFDTSADFSGITGSKDLFINRALHKAYIAVDEYGTEAAAVTAIVMNPTSIMVDEPERFKADHPFMFLIRDKKTGAILFLGKLMDPKA